MTRPGPDTGNAPSVRAVVTVHTPFAIRRRGGRKLILTPAGHAQPTAVPRIDDPLLRAVVRAFHFKRLLHEGMHATIGELAAAHRQNVSNTSRLLRLTLLPPKIVEAIVAGTSELRIQDVLGGGSEFP